MSDAQDRRPAGQGEPTRPGPGRGPGPGDRRDTGAGGPDGQSNREQRWPTYREVMASDAVSWREGMSDVWLTALVFFGLILFVAVILELGLGAWSVIAFAITLGVGWLIGLASGMRYGGPGGRG